MKLNVTKAIICTVIALLAALALWHIPDSVNQKWCLAIGGGVLSLTTLVLGLGVRYDAANVGVNIKVLSTLALLVGIIANVIMGLTGFSVVFYLIVVGLILAVYLLLLGNLLEIARENPNL